MAGSHQAVPSFPEKGLEIPSGRMGPGTVKVLNDIQGAPVQVDEQLVLAFHDRFLDNIRVLLEERTADPGEKIRLQAEDGSDTDGFVQGIGFPAAGKQRFHVRFQPAEPIEKSFSRRCQADA